MNAIVENTRGLRLLVNLNRDRILYVATILVALAGGAWLGTITTP